MKSPTAPHRAGRRYLPAQRATSGVYLSPAAAPGGKAASSRTSSSGVRSISTADTFSSRWVRRFIPAIGMTCALREYLDLVSARVIGVSAFFPSLD